MNIVVFIVLCFGIVSSQIYQYEFNKDEKRPVRPSQPGSCVKPPKKGTVWMYPNKGGWYRDRLSRKFYFKIGLTIYLEGSNNRYSRWVSTDGRNYERNDFYDWTFDKNGRWYTTPDEKACKCGCDKSCPCKGECGCKSCGIKRKFPIPHAIIGCRLCQIRLPYRGTWYRVDGIPVYVEGNFKYKRLPDGNYKKYMGICEVECYGLWNWDRATGEWMLVNCCICNNNPCLGKPGCANMGRGLKQPGAVDDSNIPQYVK